MPRLESGQMTTAEWLTFGGTVAGLFFVGLGMLIATIRVLTDKIQKGDAELHGRVNRIRDEYVKSADMDKHMERQERSLELLRTDFRDSSKETARRLDAVIAALYPMRPPGGDIS